MLMSSSLPVEVSEDPHGIGGEGQFSLGQPRAQSGIPKKGLMQTECESWAGPDRVGYCSVHSLRCKSH